MCTGKVENILCPTCGYQMDTRFTVDPCVTIKSNALACCTYLSPASVKPKDVKAPYDCYECRLDAPRRAEEAKKAAEAAKKAEKAAEEAFLPKTSGGDVDLVLHSAQYW